MREVLSQEEIDMLLSAISTGEVSAEDMRQPGMEAKPYDFRRPNKFSKDQLRTLHMIHDNFSRLLSNFLSAYVRANVQIKIASVDQLTYEDFVVSLPVPTIMAIFSMNPLKGTVILETNPAFIFPILDLLFGGPGRPPERIREPTDIELSVARKVVGKMLEQLVYAWSDIFQFSPQIESMETNAQFNQIMSPNETVALITLSTLVEGQQGMLNLCLPFLTLEEILPRLTARYWFASQEDMGLERWRPVVNEVLQDVELDMVAVCGEARLSVQQFLDLEPGDVISLDTTVHDELQLLVGNKLTFLAQPGLIGNHLAVQIVDWAREEEQPGGGRAIIPE
ncbi:MAG: flagellar motor switch protein FliM [Clostridia bacterium]|nr:MAG: flagellar motor switch protein FliM [Clostridia bacterium]